MIIDLKEWTEYVADDCGAPPLETPLEYMQILTADAVREIPEEICPPAWKPTKGTVVARTYWRVKK